MVDVKDWVAAWSPKRENSDCCTSRQPSGELNCSLHVQKPEAGRPCQSKRHDGTLRFGHAKRYGRSQKLQSFTTTTCLTSCKYCKRFMSKICLYLAAENSCTPGLCMVLANHYFKIRFLLAAYTGIDLANDVLCYNCLIWFFADEQLIAVKWYRQLRICLRG